MANASSKRIASQNEKALNGLARFLVIVNGLAVLVRWMKHKVYGRDLFPGKWVLVLQVTLFIATLFIWRWFVEIGTPKRDGKGGVRVGEDLTSGGVIEMAWDIVYLTWICTIGSALLGSWVWWLALLIPGFASYKVFGVAKPFLGMLLPGVFGPSAPKDAQEEAQPAESKKQAKLRARMEKGDRRVQAVKR